jgi:hypothetical protein
MPSGSPCVRQRTPQGETGFISKEHRGYVRNLV